MHDHHVLVVDDDPDIREALASIIREEGYEVVEAGDGRAALDYLHGANEKPCIVLLDLMMPVKSGWEVAGDLAKDEGLRKVAVVLLTADARSAANDVRTRDLPVFPKPLDLTKLMNTIEEHCGAPN